MKRVIFALVGGALVMASAWASAAGAASPAHGKCDGDSPGVTSVMRDCNDDDKVRQDHELNLFYKKAMTQRDAAGRAALRDHERAWLKRRQRECDKIYNADDGTDSLLEYDGCWLDMTGKRIAELKALAGGTGIAKRP